MFNKKGFTLVEMLVVIAIIAVLVAIIVPTAINASAKAKAATDAANLRTILGQANVQLIAGDIDSMKQFIKEFNMQSKLYPNAELVLGYKEPAIYDIFFKDGTNYYNINYFSEYTQSVTGTVLSESNLEGYDLISFSEATK